MLFSDRISLPYLVIIQDTMLYVGKWVATTRFPNVEHALFRMIDCRTHPFSPTYFVTIIVVPDLFGKKLDGLFDKGVLELNVFGRKMFPINLVLAIEFRNKKEFDTVFGVSLVL